MSHLGWDPLDTGLDKGGGRLPDLGPDKLGGGAVGTSIYIQDVGDDATHWEGVGQIPPQGGPQADREAILYREVNILDILPAGGRDVGIRTAGF